MLSLSLNCTRVQLIIYGSLCHPLYPRLPSQSSLNLHLCVTCCVIIYCLCSGAVDSSFIILGTLYNIKYMPLRDGYISIGRPREKKYSLQGVNCAGVTFVLSNIHRREVLNNQTMVLQHRAA